MSEKLEPYWEGVGNVEACDWCGRPGRVIQLDVWRDFQLVCRNPSLCSVCELIPDIETGDVYETYLDEKPDLDRLIGEFESELMRKWSEKVADGRRTPPAPGEQSGIEIREIRR